MELPNLSGPREVNVSTTAFWWGYSVWSFSSTFPDRGIITYDQIREALGSYCTHLPSSVWCTSKRNIWLCNFVPWQCSCCLHGWLPLSAGSCETALGYALDTDCCFMMSGCSLSFPSSQNCQHLGMILLCKWMQGAVPQISPRCRWKQLRKNNSMGLFTCSAELAAGVSELNTPPAVNRHTSSLLLPSYRVRENRTPVSITGHFMEALLRS